MRSAETYHARSSDEPPRLALRPARREGSDPGNAQFFLQFITRYLHWTGELRCRVTTVTRRWIDGTQIGEVITGACTARKPVRELPTTERKLSARPTLVPTHRPAPQRFNVVHAFVLSSKPGRRRDRTGPESAPTV